MTRHGSSCPAAGMQEESDLEQEQLRLMLKASKDRCEAEQEETKHLPYSTLSSGHRAGILPGLKSKVPRRIQCGPCRQCPAG